MIADVLRFLRNRLNKAVPRDSSGGPVEDLFAYVGTDKDDSVSFKSDAMSMLLIRIEEDATLRPPDLYARVSSDGTSQKMEPEIRMNLYILFVARFPDDYSRSLHYLSRVIRYFQNHRVFNLENSPDLGEDLCQLIMELVTPSFSEQNEIWGALRAAYLPSALYKLKLIVFQDQDARSLTAAKELIHTVSQVPRL